MQTIILICLKHTHTLVLWSFEEMSSLLLQVINNHRIMIHNIYSEDTDDYETPSDTDTDIDTDDGDDEKEHKIMVSSNTSP